jgi:hypothetical protein
MDSGYDAACAGLAAQVQALELVANNLANLNTAGYRADNRPPSAPSWRATAAFIPMPTAIWSHKTAIRCNPPSPILATQAAPVGRGPKAAREFEAQLIGSLLESMEKTFAALPGEDRSSESITTAFSPPHALSQAIAEGGGFGIAP